MDIKNFMLEGEEEVYTQVAEIAESPAYNHSKIRIMPDAHVGIASCIGFTATFSDKICPNTVGVDIGCRVSTYPLGVKTLDLEKLDRIIHKNIPSGFSVREKECELSKRSFSYDELHCWDYLDKHNRIRNSLGTLGGGNHYIEVDRDPETKEYYLTVHCGSRGLGKKVAEYYQALAECEYNERKRERENSIRDFMMTLPPHMRQSYLNSVRMNEENIKKDYLYVSGKNLENYLSDAALCQFWSYLNHVQILSSIVSAYGYDFNAENILTTIHNYVDVNNKIIRKGAISGYKGEVQLIPLNMRDGMLIVEALGNEDWNCSLPHGAGRIMSREAARKSLDLEEYKREMSEIYSSCVCENTIDEAPMAYKNANLIKEAIEDNAIILKHLVPVYNFKAKE